MAPKIIKKAVKPPAKTEMEIELEKRQTKEKKEDIDMEAFLKKPAMKSRMQTIMETFFIKWIVEHNYKKCKEMCDTENIVFYNKRDDMDSENFDFVTIQMYSFQQNFIREKIKVVNHVIENNTLYFRSAKRDNQVFDCYITFIFNKNEEIIRIEANEIDLTDKFDNVAPKTYNYKEPEKPELAELPMWDKEYELQQQKGTLYAMMFKLYRCWLLSQDVHEMMKLMAPNANLQDKVMNRSYYTGKECAHYFFTFVAHHYVSGIYVRQYKIIDNELFVRIHWPTRKEVADIMVVVKIDKTNNTFTEIILKKAYFDPFTDKNDATYSAMKKMEIVHERRLADKNRKREDFKSAVFYEMDENMKDLNLDTFATSDTEIFLEDKIINENKYDKKIEIEPRIYVVPSPKAPLKLIYDFKTPSYNTEELFGIKQTSEDEFGNKKLKIKKDRGNDKPRRGILHSDESFLSHGTSKNDSNKVSNKVSNKSSNKSSNKTKLISSESEDEVPKKKLRQKPTKSNKQVKQVKQVVKSKKVQNIDDMSSITESVSSIQSQNKKNKKVKK